jgi:hypothetical protein
MILKFIYTLFLGILLALFVGLGVAAFYEQPKAPEYPSTLRYAEPLGKDQQATISAQQRQDQIKYDKDFKDYQQKIEIYNRNVSIICLVAAILFLSVSLLFLKDLLLISDGLLLGGIFTILYSIVRGFSTNDNKFHFVIVTIGLLIALVLGYIKFIKPIKPTSR